MKRVLVCGGRDYNDVLEVKRVLDSFQNDVGVSLIIHGGQTGADTLADDWALENGALIAKFPVSRRAWMKLGKSAGPIRNRIMLELKPDIVFAFPGGRGTADMVKAAKAAGVAVLELVPERGKHESE